MVIFYSLICLVRIPQGNTDCCESAENYSYDDISSHMPASRPIPPTIKKILVII